MNDSEIKRKRIETGVKIGGLAIVGFLIAPFVFIAVKGLIGAVIALAVSATVINFIPWFGAKLANWRIMALKHEAGKNPIPTLENEFLSRSQKIKEFEQALKSFLAAVNSFHSKLSNVKKQFPDEAEKFELQYSKMRQLYELRATKFKEAGIELNKFQATINKAKIIWDLGQEAKKMSDAAGIGDDELIAQIQTETALDSVQKSLDMAFSDLEFSLMEEKNNTTNYIQSEASHSSTGKTLSKIATT